MKLLLILALILTPTAHAYDLTPYAVKTKRWKPEWTEALIKAMPTVLTSEVDAAYAAVPYCPKFVSLSLQQRAEFWAYVAQAITVPESGMIPTAGMVENMGKDMVTKQTIVSSGLMQLSHQDAKIHGCAFDWEKDKDKDRKDPRWTVNDPVKNLQCGIKILGKQIAKKKGLFTKKNYYWSVLREGSRGSVKVKAQLKGMPKFCY